MQGVKPAFLATAAAASSEPCGVAISMFCDALEDRIAGLGRLAGGAVQMRQHGRRGVDFIFGDHRQRVLPRGGVGNRRPGGDDGKVVARHVGDHQRHDARRRGGRGEASALDRREMLAHAIHLGNRRAALEQRLVDDLLFLQAHAFGRQGQQRRAAARNQRQHEIVSRSAPPPPSARASPLRAPRRPARDARPRRLRCARSARHARNA